MMQYNHLPKNKEWKWNSISANRSVWICLERNGNWPDLTLDIRFPTIKKVLLSATHLSQLRLIKLLTLAHNKKRKTNKKQNPTLLFVRTCVQQCLIIASIHYLFHNRNLARCPGPECHKQHHYFTSRGWSSRLSPSSSHFTLFFDNTVHFPKILHHS